MAERIDYTAGVPIRTVTMSLEEFLAIPPFPGHRNSAERARKARHLFHFVPEHLDVALAEYLDDSGQIRLTRITGNTRAIVWAEGLSDYVPSHVLASIYSYTTEAEVRQAALRFDSPDAAWRPKDYAYRASGMTFQDEWRPRSAEGKSPRLWRAIRMADAFVGGHYEPERGVTQIETVMPNWREEIKIFDAICETPLMVPDANFSTGVQAACLLLYRFEEQPLVDDFIRQARSDNGTKTEEGMDGVLQLVEVMKARGRGVGRATKRADMDDVKKCLTAFDNFKRRSRQSRVSIRIDPVVYARQQRDSQREQERGKAL